MSQHITVKIGAVGDPVLFPELAILIDNEGEVKSVGILEAGMESGATSVGFNIRMPNGKYVWAQMSAGMLLTIAGAVKGAVERFEHK